MTNLDNESDNGSQNSNFFYSVDLLVREETKKLSFKTSDPTRTNEALLKYLGLQSFHQNKLGLQYFMNRMLNKEVFSHEIEVLATKMILGCKWRKENLSNSVKCNQCKLIVRTRLKLLNVKLKNWNKINKREVKSLDQLINGLKLRMKRRQFDGHV